MLRRCKPFLPLARRDGSPGMSLVEAVQLAQNVQSVETLGI